MATAATGLSVEQAADAEASFRSALRKAAAEIGFQFDPVETLPENLRNRVDLLLRLNDRRIYVQEKSVAWNSRRGMVQPRVYFDVGDGGSAEVRLDGPKGSWTAYFGGVPIFEAVETRLDEFLRTLLKS